MSETTDELPNFRKIVINSQFTSKSIDSPLFPDNYVCTAKYTVFTFLPKFLLEQFRRYHNLFFLFISCLQQVPTVSPTGRWTTIFPLIIILSLSAMKEILEDFMRHKQDKQINHQLVEVIRNGDFASIRWKDVLVGDVIRLEANDVLPCDICLLSTSEPEGICYVETASLDGETNLKMRKCIEQTVEASSPTNILDFECVIEAESPNKHIYQFTANISIPNDTSYPLGSDQLLQRSAILKNTEWIMGVAVYTGIDTKLVRNSSKAPFKRSSVEKVMNFQILILLVLLLVLAAASALAEVVWSSSAPWYIPHNVSYFSGGKFFFSLLTFIILYNNLVPISLQVSLEIVKLFQAFFISVDLQMFHEESGIRAEARTSNLNEELGQVKYVFSDKTGTLTCNVMTFKMCSIAGNSYGDMDAHKFVDSSLAANMQDAYYRDTYTDFMLTMALCHTVMPEKGTLEYQAASPDERALVLGACEMGYVFKDRIGDRLLIDIYGELTEFQFLNIINFNSDRKRMSVVVQDSYGRLRLFCKGADNVICKRLGPNQRFVDATIQHLKMYAREGLRTLCFASATLDKAEYEAWTVKFKEANMAIVDRERRIGEVAELLEKNLDLLGATAIEDKLQEGVADTIKSLANACIKVWILTGDQQETAINIGHSCHLLNENMTLVIINEGSLEGTQTVLKQELEKLEARVGMGGDYGLVIDGSTLRFALLSECRNLLLELCLTMQAVICCRVSPSQKADLVSLVRTDPCVVTLAIGDGANDVSMIQAAHVGIGISGMEGMQATLASDYSIGQFRFLKRLLLVHGAWSYSRIVHLILYSFYKNICLYLIEFWFVFKNGFSGQILFDTWAISFYNLIFTSLPPLVMGIFDRPGSSKLRMQFPIMYKVSQMSQLFNTKVFCMWTLNSIIHSLILFWFPLWAFDLDIVYGNGMTGDISLWGNTVYTCVILVVCFKFGLETFAWTLVTHLAIWCSISLWLIFMSTYGYLFAFLPFIGADMYNMGGLLFSCPTFYFCVLLVPFFTLLRDFTWKSVKQSYFAGLEDNVMIAEIMHKDPADLLLDFTKQSLGGIARHFSTVTSTSSDNNMHAYTATLGGEEPIDIHGFAFAAEENNTLAEEQRRRYGTL